MILLMGNHSYATFYKKKQKINNYHIFFEIAGLSRQTSNYQRTTFLLDDFRTNIYKFVILLR